jgi:hypothetical protein
LRPKLSEAFAEKAVAFLWSGREPDAEIEARKAWANVLKASNVDPDDAWYACDVLLDVLVHRRKLAEAQFVIAQARKMPQDDGMKFTIDEAVSRIAKAEEERGRDRIALSR